MTNLLAGGNSQISLYQDCWETASFCLAACLEVEVGSYSAAAMVPGLTRAGVCYL